MFRTGNALLLLLALVPAAQAAPGAMTIEFRKPNGCCYCLAWTKHLEENGFAASRQDMPSCA